MTSITTKDGWELPVTSSDQIMFCIFNTYSYTNSFVAAYAIEPLVISPRHKDKVQISLHHDYLFVTILANQPDMSAQDHKLASAITKVINKLEMEPAP